MQTGKYEFLDIEMTVRERNLIKKTIQKSNRDKARIVNNLSKISKNHGLKTAELIKVLNNPDVSFLDKADKFGDDCERLCALFAELENAIDIKNKIAGIVLQCRQEIIFRDEIDDLSIEEVDEIYSIVFSRMDPALKADVESALKSKGLPSLAQPENVIRELPAKG